MERPLSDSLDLTSDEFEEETGPISPSTEKSRPDKTAEEAIELSEEPNAARIAQILATGSLTARVQAIFALIPPDRHGCLVRERDGDIFKYRQLGYRVETKDSLQGVTGLHGTGDSRIRIGDAIVMTTSKRNKEAIRKVEMAITRKKLEQAEREYALTSRQNPDVPVLDEGSVTIDTTVKSL